MAPCVPRYWDSPKPAPAESSLCSEQLLASLREVLEARLQAYVAVHSVRPTLEQIKSDAEWLEQFDRVKELELQSAQQPVPGQCSRYIVRRRRFCQLRASDGLHGLCSQHGRELFSDADVPLACGSVNPQNISLVSAKPTGRRKTNSKRRMTKMTNPLAEPYQKRVDGPDDWANVFPTDVTRPLLLDIGCAKGGFVKNLATTSSSALVQAKGGINYNLLGLEIYDPLVLAANEWVEANRASLSLDAHFIACNANVSLANILNASCCPQVAAVCIQFPDPWSRQRQAARRVVTPAFVDMLATILPEGGEVYCCSDVRALSEEMFDVFDNCKSFALDEATYMRVGALDVTDVPTADPELLSSFDPAHLYQWQPAASEHMHAECTRRKWLSCNPYMSVTERDLVCEQKWRPVYRSAFIRIRQTCVPLVEQG